MSGADQMSSRRWSTRQRLVVLTFETNQAADRFDLSGNIVPMSLVGSFDVHQLDADGLVALMEACRDVIDSWDDIAERATARLHATTHAQFVERLRRVLFDVRQAAMS